MIGMEGGQHVVGKLTASTRRALVYWHLVELGGLMPVLFGSEELGVY